MAILDPELDILLATKAYYEQNPAEGSLLDSPDKPIYIAVQFTGDIAALQQIGFTVASTVGHIAYGVTDLAGLQALATHPQVERIGKQRRRRIQLDESVPDIEATQVSRMPIAFISCRQWARFWKANHWSA